MTAFVCGAKIGYPFTYQVIFPFLPIPQHIWVGKDVGLVGKCCSQAGRGRCPACPGLSWDAGGCRRCRWLQGPWEFGDQRVAAVKVMSLPLPRIPHITLNTLWNTITASMALPRAVLAPDLHRAKRCCPLRERTNSRLNILKCSQLLFKIIVIVCKCMFLSLF